MKFNEYGMLNIMSPCKDCEYRHIGCHSECEDYFQFKKQVAEARTRQKQFEHESRMNMISYKKIT